MIASKVIVPFINREIGHIFPAEGPGTYRNVGASILGKGLKVPTGEYTVSFLHAVLCNRAKFGTEHKILLNILNCRSLLVYQNHLWTFKGVYSVKDFRAKGIDESLNEKDLEERLKGGKEIRGLRFSIDEAVGFAPIGSYRFGEHSPESLAKDGTMIIDYGEIGAEQMGEAASVFGIKPSIFGFDIKEGWNPVQTIGNLNVKWSGRLSINPYCKDSDLYDSNCAFAVVDPWNAF